MSKMATPFAPPSLAARVLASRMPPPEHLWLALQGQDIKFIVRHRTNNPHYNLFILEFTKGDDLDSV